MQEQRLRRLSLAIQAVGWIVLIVGYGVAEWYLPVARPSSGWRLFAEVGVVAIGVEWILQRGADARTRRAVLLRVAIAFAALAVVAAVVPVLHGAPFPTLPPCPR